jgi:hypothetical protein
MSALIVQLKAAEREGRGEDVRRLNAEINRVQLKKAGAQTVEAV